MSENKEDALHISAEVMDKLRKARAEMIQSFNDHTAGKNPLSAEQSLGLRSHIATLTEFIEPGVKEMWPDYSAEETFYLDNLALHRQRDANKIGVAALGLPLALPAVAADLLDAPPEAVSNFIEFGYNMAVIAGMNRAGLQPVRNVAIKPVSVNSGAARTAFEMLENAPVKGAATNNAFFNAKPVTDINGMLSPKIATLKVARSAINFSGEADPILSWLKHPEVERLGSVLAEYGAGRGQFLADLREEGQSGKTIQTILDKYRNSPEGRSHVYADAYKFETRFAKDILDINGEADPTKLQLTVARLQAGQYLTARDYAALEQARHLAHTDYVEYKVKDYVAMAEIVKLDGASLQQGIHEVRQQAETASPYSLAPGAVQNHPAPDLGREP